MIKKCAICGKEAEVSFKSPNPERRRFGLCGLHCEVISTVAVEEVFGLLKEYLEQAGIKLGAPWPVASTMKAIKKVVGGRHG